METKNKIIEALEQFTKLLNKHNVNSWTQRTKKQFNKFRNKKTAIRPERFYWCRYGFTY